MSLRNILEIGFGGNPLGIADWHSEGLGGFCSIEKNLQLLSSNLPPGVHYHGVDFTKRFNPEELARAPKWCRGYVGRAKAMLDYYHQHEEQFPTIILAEMDARNLSFPPKLFDEVHLYYILSDPSVTPVDGAKILSEACRVMAQDGVLVILGEKYFVPKGTQIVIDRESQAKNMCREGGLVIDENVVDENACALENTSCVGTLAEKLLEYRRQALDRSSSIDPEAYLLIAHGRPSLTT